MKKRNGGENKYISVCNEFFVVVVFIEKVSKMWGEVGIGGAASVLSYLLCDFW